jgi:hypothetical protein
MMPVSNRAATVPIMTMSDGRSTGPQLRSGPLITGAALVGADVGAWQNMPADSRASVS